MIRYELFDRVANVRISSGKGNLIGGEDLAALDAALDRALQDPDVDGMVLLGEERCFCTGLNPGSARGTQTDDLFFRFDTLLLKLFTFPKPVVAALDGHSIGGGLLLQCCADYVTAADTPHAKVGLPELKIGLTVDALMAELMLYTLGSRRVLQQLLYSGEYISVSRAKEINLIDELVPREELERAARHAAARLGAYDGNAFRATKTTLRAQTAERMRAAVERRCHEIFKELKQP